MKKSSKAIFFIACFLLSLLFLTGCTSQVPSSNSTPESYNLQETRFIPSTNGIYSVNATVPTITKEIMIYSVVPSSENTSEPNNFQETRLMSSTNGIYSINTVVPRIHGKTMTYTIEKPNYTREQISSLAKKMGMSGEIRETNIAYYLNKSDEDKYQFDVGKKIKSITFANHKGGPSGGLTDSEAISIVKEFVKNADLLPPDAQEPEIIHNTGRNTVGFSRSDKELPVSGSTFTISVDSQGKIVEIYMIWNDYSPYKQVSLITPESAFEEFQTKKLIFAGPGSMINPEKIVVTRVLLVYSETNRKYLVPTYLFFGYGQKGGTKLEFDTVKIPAISEELE